ncbi:MAG: EVE domain-containing protein [Thermoproteota archaeon]
MSISLNTLLDLVGKLDDSPGTDTPRERFRKFLSDNVKNPSIVRDYIEECLRNSGEQYERAFQDLVNHLGILMHFKVEFGRYQGVSGEIGFDGLWKSSDDFSIVVEVKKTDVYTIRTSTLFSYISELVSEKKIASLDNALGLYVIGKIGPGTSQLENTIIAEKRTDQLRVISVESLLSLAELMSEYDVSYEDILAIIKPSGPKIDPIVDMITRLIAEEPIGKGEGEEKPPIPPPEGEAQYWLTPVKGDEKQTAEEVIETLLGKAGIYAFGERTPGRTHIKPGDWICFYACGKGVVAHCQVASFPENKPHPKVRHPDKYPWTFKVSNVKLYLDKPVVIDAVLRAKLDAFSDADPQRPWAWFVQSTRSITQKDFELLTRQRNYLQN